MLKTHVANASLLRLIWSLPAGGSMVNVLGVFTAGGVVVNQALANTLAAAIKSSFSTGAYKTHIPTGNALATVGIRDIRNVDLPEYVDSAAAVPGTAAGDQLARQVALVVTLRTAFAGRGNRGRIYLGGFDEASEDA